ncbi:MAG TPA: glycerophosphodiester phosphodiesterase family protein [Methylomirabilota bacterium]|jgi:glycerophosphoryl diester phosphodiesterase|nr:glycerophosphodiester phosphodiesterase family protein [Methylomirabilota bacterium]
MRPAGVALLALAWVVASGPAFAQGAPASLVAAHRGGALLWPENSLLAFRNAIALGADYIEFDVHLSKDGEVVVIHDPTLERTTTGQGPVREQALAHLRTLHLKDRAGVVSEERVPTLDEVAAVAVQAKRRMLLEIKVDDRRQRYPGIEEKVIAILDRHAMTGSTVVMAFEAPTWRRVRELRPDIEAGALYSPRTLEAMASTAPRELAEAARAGVRFVGLHQALIGADALAAARTAGVTLGAWTVNEPDALRRLIEQKVGVLITDRPDLAKSLLNR